MLHPYLPAFFVYTIILYRIMLIGGIDVIINVHFFVNISGKTQQQFITKIADLCVLLTSN